MGGSSRPRQWRPRQPLTDDEVNGYLRDQLRTYNQRDTDAIDRHLTTLKQALEQSDDDTIHTRFGGSVSRHTYVNGLSDVDTLFILNDSSLAGQSPNAVIRRMAALIRQRLPGTTVGVGKLAVTITYKDGHEIQVLPAIRTQAGVRIAEPNRNQWSNVLHPERFARKLTQVNQSQRGQVVPTIKLAKALVERLTRASNDHISGYHMESLAIEAFRAYRGPSGLKDMLVHLTRHSERAVQQPIKDSTGQSRNVDGYLGPQGSAERQRASHIFRRMRDGIERSNSTNDLRNLFEL